MNALAYDLPRPTRPVHAGCYALRMATPARALRHVMLETGELRDSPRSKTSSEAVAAGLRLLELAAAQEEVEILCGALPCRMKVSRGGHCALIQVAAPSGAALATIAVAGRSRCGTPLWRRLHEDGTKAHATDRARVPLEPWCAVRVEQGIETLTGEQLERVVPFLTHDLAVQLAWALLERRR